MSVLRAVGKLVSAFLVAAAFWAGSAQALSLQPVGSFEQPIYVTSDPGNPERLFVVERAGMVLLLQNGEIKTFADIRSKVSTGSERGLLSIALAPDFDSSGRLFLDYTGREKPGEIHVAEMVAGGGSAPLSTLRDVIPPITHEKGNHNGGQLQFGPEGALFISTGDGGGENDELHNAQNPASELGKILRLASPGPLAAPEIWSLGLRNPFRFSFDRATGAMLIGDVGQSAREEVDMALAPGLGEGANYGWNCMEGSIAGPPPPDEDPQCPENAGKFTAPIFEYPHEDPEDGGAFGCAIIGGYVNRGPGMGDAFGRYLYGDLCQGDIRSFSLAAPALTDRSEGVHVENLNSFGEDSCGRLYAVSGDGPVYRLEGPEAAACGTSAGPPPLPLAASFIGVRAVSRKVRRHRRGLITAWVTPCSSARRGDPVTLYRGRRRLGTRRLDRACSVRFRPRINRRSSFRATVKGDEAYLPAISRKLTIKPVRRRR